MAAEVAGTKRSRGSLAQRRGVRERRPAGHNDAMIGALRMRVLVEWFGGGIGYEASAGRVNAAHPIVVLVR